jgi:hypothetical protein
MSQNENKNKIEELTKIFGRHTVFLPLVPGEKFPVKNLKGWQKTDLARTQKPKYQEALSKSDIGILCGSASSNLISIDCDTDEFAKDLIDLNPAFSDCTRSRGNRGQNIWIRIEGDLPKSSKLTQDGNQIGEIRCDANLTKIWGKHPEGQNYEIERGLGPIEMSFGEIIWPDYVNLGQKPKKIVSPPSSPTSTKTLKNLNTKNLITYDTERLYNYDTITLYNNTSHSDPNPEDRIKLMRLRKLSLEKLQKWKDKQRKLKRKDIIWLYEEFIEKYFAATPNQRNEVIVKSSVRIHRAMTRDLALELLMTFYDVNQHYFRDNRMKHQIEANSMLNSLEDSFRSLLNDTEKTFYLELDAELQGLFRVMWDLARSSTSEFPPGHFFLSDSHIKRRIGLKFPTQASRLRSELEEWDIIECVERGKTWSKGEKSKASKYIWLLRKPNEWPKDEAEPYPNEDTSKPSETVDVEGVEKFESATKERAPVLETANVDI